MSDIILLASEHTINARVESRPPEMPMTRFLIPVERTLVARPFAESEVFFGSVHVSCFFRQVQKDS